MSDLDIFFLSLITKIPSFLPCKCVKGMQPSKQHKEKSIWLISNFLDQSWVFCFRNFLQKILISALQILFPLIIYSVPKFILFSTCRYLHHYYLPVMYIVVTPGTSPRHLCYLMPACIPGIRGIIPCRRYEQMCTNAKFSLSITQPFNKSEDLAIA